MGFDDPLIGAAVVLGIAFLTLALILLGRRIFKTPSPDEGINESRDLDPHEHHVGSGAADSTENRQSTV